MWLATKDSQFGDVLEISSDTSAAEILVISRFASIHLVSATRNPHPRVAAGRRFVEGADQRYVHFED